MGSFLVLAVNLVGHGKLFTAFGATGCQHAATVGRSHAMAETMFVVSLAVVGLKCSFHLIMWFLFVMQRYCAFGLQN